MHVEPWLLGQPRLHLGMFLGRAVVDNQMDIEALFRFTVEFYQKALELIIAMSGQAFPDHTVPS